MLFNKVFCIGIFIEPFSVGVHQVCVTLIPKAAYGDLFPNHIHIHSHGKMRDFIAIFFYYQRVLQAFQENKVGLLIFMGNFRYDLL